MKGVSCCHFGSFYLFVFFVCFCLLFVSLVLFCVSVTIPFFISFYDFLAVSVSLSVWSLVSNVLYRDGLVSTNVLAHLYHERVFFFFQLWQIVLLGNTDWAGICDLLELWSFSTLFQRLLAFQFLIEKLAVTLIGFPIFVTCGFSLAVFHALSLFFTFSVLTVTFHVLFWTCLFHFLCVFLGFVYECLSLFWRKFLSVVWLTIYATDKGFLSVFYTINTCSFQCHKIPMLLLRTFNFFIFFVWVVQIPHIIFKSWYSIFYLMYSPGVAFL